MQNNKENLAAPEVCSKELPRDEACEAAVLGSLMADRAAFAAVADILNEECFYTPTNRAIYRAIKACADAGQETDLLNVSAAIQKAGEEVPPYAIAEICGKGGVYGYEEKARRIFDLAKKRDLWLIGMKIAAEAINPTTDPLEVQEAAAKSLNGVYSDAPAEVQTLGDALGDLNERINENASGTRRTGTPIGFVEFDERGGFQQGDFVVVAATASTGKTAFALSVALHAAKQGAPIAIYSMEMQAVQLAARATAAESGINANVLLYNAMQVEEWQVLDKAVGRLEKLPVYFDENSNSSLSKIVASIRRMKKAKKIEGVFVDYLQILNVNEKTANREQLMGDTARQLKNLAKDLKIWIVALSQINRNEQQNPYPTISRIRDSGQIAEAADVVMMLYRPQDGRRYPAEFEACDTHGTCLIDVQKGRNIGTFRFLAGFEAETTRFFDLYGELPITAQKAASIQDCF